ncbi:MAG TPA: D-aminoacyl-tRNA deacylase [Bacteroidales bacterium]|mgnify:CR=1 FL=1|jgi:D-tyrosyl-tRNA(Tyr) deacylase|nr:D-aminoacyl-tRNA deacylase [Bacteroidales bacterium]HOL97351.1 D-aminoacyl-tRNA deacylase [Bacteroidales bacterium]HOM36082.1 D-aminoacyl-tRNA deacylase [Bacteroidales bacterium]HPD22917.1 D-aminoacyl-tRNA deacylase [Bacteroidales bacterium]HRS98585.1 D-aminoacyl-tRNA deacylase [Bacteroidales bacterium]
MIAVIQRVNYAKVTVNHKIVGEIEKGLLVLLGIEQYDDKEDIKWLANKIVNLRIFDDENGVMNKSCIELNYNILTVSQFTLHARTKKGNRPSYIDAAPPEIAIPLYEEFISYLNILMRKETQKGIFGAHMDIELLNNGPVTIIIDTKNKK